MKFFYWINNDIIIHNLFIQFKFTNKYTTLFFYKKKSQFDYCTNKKRNEAIKSLLFSSYMSIYKGRDLL